MTFSQSRVEYQMKFIPSLHPFLPFLLFFDGIPIDSNAIYGGEVWVSMVFIDFQENIPYTVMRSVFKTTSSFSWIEVRLSRK
mmetsp:Transcript_14168/g.19676  ORF Transcript_14168/g.19676 Transcript_14168/m.19676 type:complete len:82 (+) Transcript_14168:207-452(+)